MLSEVIYVYMILYQIGVIVCSIGSWVSLSYVDRIHFRERARRYGVMVTSIIENMMVKRIIYDKFRILIIRPICVILETLIGFLEGIENFESVIVISENNRFIHPLNQDSTSIKSSLPLSEVPEVSQDIHVTQ